MATSLRKGRGSDRGAPIKSAPIKGAPMNVPRGVVMLLVLAMAAAVLVALAGNGITGLFTAGTAGADNAPVVNAANGVGSVTPIVIYDDKPFTLDLNALFSDPDGDALTFIATSADGLDVSVSGGTLMLTRQPAASGERTITVIASDGAKSASQALAINLPPGADTATSYIDESAAAAPMPTPSGARPALRPTPTTEPEPVVPTPAPAPETTPTTETAPAPETTVPETPAEVVSPTPAITESSVITPTQVRPQPLPPTTAAAPVVTSLILNSTNSLSNSTNQNLTLWVVGTDADGDNISYEGEWYRNGSIFVGQYWNRTLGGMYDDQGHAVAADASGNVYVTGQTTSDIFSNADCWTIKYDANGNQLWNKTLGGTGSDGGNGIAVDAAGNVYVTGSYGAATAEVWTIKFDTDGNQLWNKTVGGSGDDYGMGIAVDAAGNVYVTGQTLSYGAGGSDVWTIKFDTNGNQLWNKTLGGSGSDSGAGIALDSSGNVYVTGQTAFGAGNGDYWTIKYNASGYQLWNKTAGGASTDYAQGVAVDVSGNVYVTGVTYSYGAGGTDVWTIKYDNNGNVLWSRTAGGTSTDNGNAIAVYASGNVYVTGLTYSFGVGGSSDVWTIKYNASGYQLWNKTYGGSATDYGQGVAVDASGNALVTGYTASFGAGGNDLWTIKYKDGFVKSNQTAGVQALASVLESQFEGVNDVWRACVTPTNGTEVGGTVCSNNVTVLAAVDQPPVITSLLLNSTNILTNDTDQNLTLLITATDPEGDNISYVGDWYLNGNYFVDQYWNKTLGGTGADEGYGVAVDAAGNIVVTGKTASFGAGSSDVWTIKYDAAGNQLWNRTVGGTGDDTGMGVGADAAGNVYVGGYTASYGAGNYDYWIIKYDANGNQQWNRTRGGTSQDNGADIAVDGDGNTVVTGYAWSFGAGSFDVWTLKYDSSGNQLWNKTTGGTNDDSARAVTLDAAGNVYVTGYTQTYGAGNLDVWTLKYNSSGGQLWNRTWGGASSEQGRGIAVDPVGNVYVAGQTDSFGAGSDDVFIVKYDSGGNQLWNRTVGGEHSDPGWGLVVDAIGNAYVTGYTGSFPVGFNKIWTLKYDTNGNQLWNRTVGGASTDEARAIALDAAGDPIVTSRTASFGAGSYDVWTIKYKDGFVKANQSSGAQVQSSLVESQYTTVGDVWGACVTPTDLSQNGTRICSNNVTIGVVSSSPPAISDVVNYSIGNESVRINWSTSVAANSTVSMGTSPSSFTFFSYNATLAAGHDLNVSNLAPYTLYYYNVTSCDASNDCNTTGPFSFRTADNAGISHVGSCGILGTSQTTYYLTGDVSATGTCWTVGSLANNVTLDCQGQIVYYATSSNGNGIYAKDHKGVVVRNCVFVNTNSAVTEATGIYVFNVTGVDLEGNTVNLSYADVAIHVQNDTNVVVANNAAYGNGSLFYLREAQNSSVRFNNFTQYRVSAGTYDAVGVDAYNTNAVLCDNQVNALIGSGQGINFWSTDNVGMTVCRNNISTRGEGVRVVMGGTGINHVITDNIINATGDGIDLTNGREVQVVNNTIMTGATGILVEADNVSVDDNRVSGYGGITIADSGGQWFNELYVNVTRNTINTTSAGISGEGIGMQVTDNWVRTNGASTVCISFGSQMRFTTISRNTLVDCYEAIAATGEDRQIVVANNRIINATLAGIYGVGPYAIVANNSIEVQRTGGGTTYGIAWPRSYSTLINNNISVAGTFGAYGIFDDSAYSYPNVNISGNSIGVYTIGAPGSNAGAGIRLDGPSNYTLKDNVITYTRAGDNQDFGGVYIANQFGANNRILNNTIAVAPNITTALANTPVRGLTLGYLANTLVANNSIFVNETYTAVRVSGIEVDSSGQLQNLSFSGNIVRVRSYNDSVALRNQLGGSNLLNTTFENCVFDVQSANRTAVGLDVAGTMINTTFRNVSFLLGGNRSVAIAGTSALELYDDTFTDVVVIASATDNNTGVWLAGTSVPGPRNLTFSGLNISVGNVAAGSVAANRSYAIMLAQTRNVSFVNLNVHDGQNELFTTTATTVTFENTTIWRADPVVVFPGVVTGSLMAVNLSRAVFVPSSASVFLRTINATPFNTTAVISWRNVPIHNARPRVDVNDTGEFHWCYPAPCTAFSANATGNNDFTLTVSHFTNYSLAEAFPPAISLVGPANGSTVVAGTNLTWNVTADGQANVSCNVTLDSIDGTTMVNSTSGDFTAFQPGSPLAPGPHYWNVSCADQNLLVNASANWQFVVESPIQTVVILNTTNPSLNDTNQNLTLYATLAHASSEQIVNLTTWYRTNATIMALYLPFEGNGHESTNATDYSGNGNNASVQNATWLPTGGHDGRGAYRFNGTSDFIEIKAGRTLNLTKEYSFSLWVYRNSRSGGYERLISKSNPADPGTTDYSHWLQIQGDDTIRMGIVKANGQSVYLQSTANVTPGVWHHIVGVKTSLLFKIYLDGVLTDQGVTGGSMGDAENNNFSIDIGRLGDANVWYYGFNGTMDEVQIWNTSLTDAQVALLYQNRTDVIDRHQLKPGDVWYACVTPNNGTADLNTACSNNVTIQAANGTLTIWDGGDVFMPYADVPVMVGQVTRFFANLSNVSGMPLNTTNGACTIDFAPYGSPQVMSWNASQNLYVYTRSFPAAQTYDYRVQCYDSGDSYLETNSITIFDYGCGVLKTSITLNHDVVAAGTCFEVNDTGITINCANHHISYANTALGYGVNASFNKDSLVVHDCIFDQTNWDVQSAHAIYFINGNSANIYNNSINVLSNFAGGVVSSSTSSVIIHDNRIFTNNTGISLTTTSDVDITDNRIYINTSQPQYSLLGQVGKGINIQDSHDIDILRNDIMKSSKGGYYNSYCGEDSDISMFNTNETLVQYNTMVGFSGPSFKSYAVRISGYNNKLLDNGINSTLSTGYGVGLFLGNTYNATIRNNTIRATGTAILQGEGGDDTYCYDMAPAHNNTIVGNDIRGASGVVFQCTVGALSCAVGNAWRTSSNIIANNTINATGGNGVALSYHTGTSVLGNTINCPAASDDGISEGIGNGYTISGNRIRACDTGILFGSDLGTRTCDNNVLENISTYGIRAGGATGFFIRNNTVTVGLNAYAEGIWGYGVIANNRVFHRGTGDSAVLITGAALVENNTILNYDVGDNAAENNFGITVATAAGPTIRNNDIQIIRPHFAILGFQRSVGGISLNSNNAYVVNNSIYLYENFTIVGIIINAANQTIINNTIRVHHSAMPVQGREGYGIWSNVGQHIISGNTINVTSTNEGYGMFARNSFDASRIENNQIAVRANMSAYGILDSAYVAAGTNFTNNTIRVWSNVSGLATGMYFISDYRLDSQRIIGGFIEVEGNNNTDLWIDSSTAGLTNAIRNVTIDGVFLSGENASALQVNATNLTVRNIVVNDTMRWLRASAPISGTFTNTTFLGDNVTVVWPGTVTVTGYVDLQKIDTMLGRRSAIVRSGTGGQFNTSAFIMVRDVWLHNPLPVIDRFDSGARRICRPPDCTNYTFNQTGNNLFTINVSHFTNYSVDEDTTPPAIELNIPRNGAVVTANAGLIWTATDDLDTNMSCNATLDSVVVVSMMDSPNGQRINLTTAPFSIPGPHYWNVSCTDGSGNANVSITAAFTVDNAPTLNRVIVNSTRPRFNSTDQNLTRYLIGLSDIEGDPIRNITTWYRNGSSTMLLNWPFEGNNGDENNTLTDYSGRGVTGTTWGAVAWRPTGGRNGQGAYFFNGSMSLLQSSNPGSVNNAVTVALWVNSRSLNNQYHRYLSSGSDSVILRDESVSRWYFYVKLGGTYYGLPSATTIQANRWFFLAGTWDGKTQRLYVNGVLDASTARTGTLDATSSWYASANWPTEAMNGTLDDIMVFNETLSDAQILALYQNRTDFWHNNDTEIGEVWSACVTPNDGIGDGNTTCGNNVTIAAGLINTPPVNLTVLLNATTIYNLTSDNLTRWITSVADENGDPVRNITTWYLNGGSTLLLNMPFEGRNGSELNRTTDYSGFGRNGTVQGAYWSEGGGHDGLGAYVFSGAQYINTSTISIADNITVSAWVKAVNFAQNMFVVQKAPVNTQWEAYFEGQFLKWRGGSIRSVNCTVPIANNTWHLVTAVQRGTSAYLYLDAVLCSAGNVSALGNGAGQIEIGRHDGPGYYFNGTIDDVLVFNRTLTANEILLLNQSRTDIVIRDALVAGDVWQVCVTPNDGITDGNMTCSNNLTVNAMVPPTIQGVINYSVTNESARINWSTDFPANSTVRYGLSQSSLASSVTNATFAAIHDLGLAGLVNNTLYYYNVTSCTDAGGCATAGPYNFTTLQNVDTIPPYILLQQAQNITNQSAVINVTTDEYTNITVYYGLVPHILTSYAYNNTFEMIRLVNLTSLVNGTQYYYNVTVCDPFMNCNTTGPFTFTTLQNVDDTIPAVTLIHPPQDINASVGWFNFSWVATDNEPALYCDLKVDSVITSAATTPGVVTNRTLAVADGVHYWNVSCSDGTNANVSETRRFWNDATPPVLDNMTEDRPSPAVYSPSSPVNLTVNVSDAMHGVDKVLLFFDNLTHVPTFIGNNRFQVILPPQPAGTHNYSWFANDTLGNWNATANSHYVVTPVDLAATGLLNITIAPGATVMYGSATTITCSATGDPAGTIALYHNASLVASGASPQGYAAAEAAGIYNITCAYPATQNYSAAQIDVVLTVERAPAFLNLSLNGTDDSIEIDIGGTVNVSANLSATRGDTVRTIAIYNNGSLADSGASPRSTLLTYPSLGIYNVTVVYAGNANHTPQSLTHFVNVQDLNAPDITLVWPPDQSNTTHQDQNFTWVFLDHAHVFNSCNLTLDGAINVSDILAQNNTITNVTTGNIPDGVHTWSVQCNDSSGNAGTSFTFTFTVHSGVPVLLGRSVDVTNQTARVNVSMDEEVNLTVRYGTTPSLGGAVANASNNANHSILITGLVNNTLYYYNLSYCDPFGNCNASGPFTFTTLQNVDTIPPRLLSRTLDVTNQSGRVNTTYNEPSNITITYGLTPALGGGSVSNASYAMRHSTLISGLQNNTLYYYNITICDPFNNCNTTGAYSFTTDNNTLLNTRPVITSIALNSTNPLTNDTDQNLTLRFTAQDDQNDPITNMTAWYVNSTPLARLYFPFVAGASNASFTRDYSGRNVVASVLNGAFWNATNGYDGRGAYFFDGANDYLSLEAYDPSTQSKEVAIDLWFYREQDTGDFERLVTAENAGLCAFVPYYLHVYGGTDVVQFGVTTGGGWVGVASSGAGTAALNTWTHVIASYNDATKDLKLFVNGVKYSTTGTGSPYGGSATWVVGRNVGCSPNTYYFRGYIDDVKIYNRALSDEQIRLLMRNDTSVISRNETGIGDQWNACVTPNDGVGDGARVCSNIVTIVDVIPPSLTNITVTPTNQSASVVVTTNEPANASVNCTPSASGLETDFALSQNVSLAPLVNNTFYACTIRSCDIYGNCNASVTTFTTLQNTDTLPPTILSRTVDVTNQTARVNITLSEPANITINYGTGLTLGTFVINRSFDVDFSQLLAPLVNGTLYRYNVTACDVFGNCMTSGPFSFTTLQNVDDVAPVLLSRTVDVTNQTGLVNTTWSENANLTIRYGITAALGNVVRVSSRQTQQSTLLSSLLNDTLYYYNLTACDAFGNCRTSGPFTFTTRQNVVRSVLTLTLDNVSAGISVVSGSVVNITATLAVGEGDVVIRIDGVTQSTGTSPRSVLHTFPTVGAFNVSAVYDGNENFTAGFVSYLVTVTSGGGGGGGGGGGPEPPLPPPCVGCECTGTCPPPLPPPPPPCTGCECTNSCPPPVPPTCPTCNPPSVEHPSPPPTTVIGGTVACVQLAKASTSVKITPLTLTAANVPIPAGYVLAKPPFQLSCSGSLELTLDVPDNLTDLRVLQCRGSECNERVETTVSTSSLKCGNVTMGDTVKQLRTQTRTSFVTRDLAAVKTDERIVAGPQATLSTQGASITITNLSGTAHAAIGLPAVAVPQPPSTAVSILGAPIQVVVKDASPGARLRIAIDIPQNPDIDPSSVVMVGYDPADGSWRFVDAVTEGSSLAAYGTVDSLLAKGNGTVIVMLAGSVCRTCRTSKLELAYNPPGARDAVVLIHGLFSDPSTFDVLIAQANATNQPFAIYTFGYPFNQSLEESGVDFADNLERIQASYDHISIAAHSAGGLVAQYGLQHAMLSRQQDPSAHTAITKVKKLVLVGVPNEGVFSPQFVKLVTSNIITTGTFARFVNADSRIIEDITKPHDIPRVPGVDYVVIAGTKDYGIPLGIGEALSGFLDGLVSVKSAQDVGGIAVNDQCRDYFQLNLTHTELIDDETAVRVIARQLFADIPQATLGRNQYLQVTIADCDPTTTYWVVGRPIPPAAIEQPLNCGCGNGVCGVGETPENCPQDCAQAGGVCSTVGIGAGLLVALAILAFVLGPLTSAVRYGRINRMMAAASAALLAAGVLSLAFETTLCLAAPLLTLIAAIVLMLLAVVLGIMAWRASAGIAPLAPPAIIEGGLQQGGLRFINSQLELIRSGRERLGRLMKRRERQSETQLSKSQTDIDEIHARLDDIKKRIRKM